jgi:hypothetical protein
MIHLIRNARKCRSFNMIRTMFVAATLALFSAGSASAALTAYDGFTGYPAGDLTGNNGGSGWSGAYTDTGNSTVIDATGLNRSGLMTVPGSVRTNDGSGTTALNFRNLGLIHGDDETETWISFLGRRNGPTAINLFAGVSFYNTNGAGTADGEVSFASTTSGPLVWRILDLGAAVSANTTAAITPDVTDLLVARIIWNVPDGTLAGTGDDAVYFYVNPALGGAPPTTTAADAGRNIAMANFDKIRIAGQNAVDYNFDEIRIGSTFADVTPIIPNNPDFNGNGVGLDDFETLRMNYLTGTMFDQGDANHDGIVNHLDFFIWRTAFLALGGSLEGVSFSLPVPEPSTGVSLLVACLIASTGRASRRRRD